MTCVQEPGYLRVSERVSGQWSKHVIPCFLFSLCPTVKKLPGVEMGTVQSSEECVSPCLRLCSPGPCPLYQCLVPLKGRIILWGAFRMGPLKGYLSEIQICHTLCVGG